MLISKKRCILELPNDWIQKDSDNSICFEAPDGRQGLYITYHSKDDVANDRELAEFTIGVEKIETRSIDGYKFALKKEEIQLKDGFVIGHLDLYDKRKGYRIASKCIVKNKNIYRLSFHDYDCGNYGKSRKMFESVIDSFEYNPNYKWAIGFPINPLNFEEAVVEQENGFLDIDLYIVSVDFNEDGSVVVSVRNDIEKQPVEFSIFFGNKWDKKEIDGSDEFFYWGKGKFINTGKYSENFLKLLSVYYGVTGTSYNNKEVDTLIVGLVNDPTLMATQKTDMKFIFNSDSENAELYSEVYINVNLSERILEFHEKDPEYRGPLIRSLYGET
jgi:hypothetical protein